MNDQAIIIVGKPDWANMTDDQKRFFALACYMAYVHHLKSKGV